MSRVQLDIKAHELQVDDIILGGASWSPEYKGDQHLVVNTVNDPQYGPTPKNTTEVFIKGLGTVYFPSKKPVTVSRKKPAPTFPDGTVALNLSGTPAVRVNGVWTNARSGRAAMWTDQAVEDNEFITVVYKPTEEAPR